jgi:hypothetical protein
MRFSMFYVKGVHGEAYLRIFLHGAKNIAAIGAVFVNRRLEARMVYAAHSAWTFQGY